MSRISRDYELLIQIGAGSFSTIHKAKRKSDGLIVAIKIFEAKSEIDVNLIITEGKVLKHLMGGHPSIPQIYELFNEGTKFFIIMEYLDGFITLLDWVNPYYSMIYNSKSNEKEFELLIKTREEEITFIFDQIISSINYLYQKSVAHRDLKLENIMIHPRTKEIKIIDFGFSIISQTMTWSTICGSFEYLSPEILQHVVKNINENSTEKTFHFTIQSEVWSLGIILYGMIYCKLPFTHENKLGLINLVLNSDIQYEPQNVISDPNLKSLLKSMLVKDPYSRINFLEIYNHPFFAGKHKKGKCRISKSYRTDIHKIAQELTCISDNNTNFQANSELCDEDQSNLFSINYSKRRVNVRNSSSLNVFLTNLSLSSKMNEAKKNKNYLKFHNTNPVIITPKLIKNT